MFGTKKKARGIDLINEVAGRFTTMILDRISMPER